jgi:hypothetical protein
VLSDPSPFAGNNLDMATGGAKLSDLEEVIGLRGWLKRRVTISRNSTSMPLLMVNEQYGQNFHRLADAIAFMDGVVEAEKQRARDRAAALRVMA